jgi:hypothetical protein
LARIGPFSDVDFPQYFFSGDNAVFFSRFGGYPLDDVWMPSELLALGRHVEGDAFG